MRLSWILTIIFGLLLTGCWDEEKLARVGEASNWQMGIPPEPDAPRRESVLLSSTPPEVVARVKKRQANAERVAQRLYERSCASCHGINGLGDAVQGLNPPPRNFADSAWQARTSDARMRQVIIGGGLENGLSPLMPARRSLENKPEVLDHLIQLIREFDPRPQS